jgi:uncharacterized YccA/Bax inhibitor family protein
MTLNGTVNKTGILLVCAIATAAWTWHLFTANARLRRCGAVDVRRASADSSSPWSPSSRRSGLRSRRPSTRCLKAWRWAASRPRSTRYPGIAIQAVGLTFGTLFVLLLAYRSGLIQVTQKFRLGIIAATGGIMVFYLLEMLLGFFGIHFTAINGSGPIGIAFSLFVVAIAALNLVLDFDFIEQGVKFGAPKYMEWYGAFGIMVTLVWLYSQKCAEILRCSPKGAPALFRRESTNDFRRSFEA